MKKNKKKYMKNIIFRHIMNNSKEYILITLIFIIGLFLGVMFINNAQETQIYEITNYFNDFINKMKNVNDLDNMSIFRSSILQNIILAIIIWFFGTTVIGIPIVFGIVLYRGFCLGYTIAKIVSIMGILKGMLFVFMTIFLQNIIFIPSLIAIAVSGFKLYKSIVKDRNKENIKMEILRHTIFSSIMLLFLCISALIETFISTNILKKFIKYF